MTTKTAAKLEVAALAYESASAGLDRAIAGLALVRRACWTLTQGNKLTTLTEDMLIDLARASVGEKAFYLDHPALIDVASGVANANMTSANATLAVAIDALEVAEKAAEKAAARSAKRRAA